MTNQELQYRQYFDWQRKAALYKRCAALNAFSRIRAAIADGKDPRQDPEWVLIEENAQKFLIAEYEKAFLTIEDDTELH